MRNLLHGSMTKVCLKVSLFLEKRSSEVSKVLLLPTNGLVPQVSSGEPSQCLVTHFRFPGDLGGEVESKFRLQALQGTWWYLDQDISGTARRRNDGSFWCFVFKFDVASGSSNLAFKIFPEKVKEIGSPGEMRLKVAKPFRSSAAVSPARRSRRTT